MSNYKLGSGYNYKVINKIARTAESDPIIVITVQGWQQ